MIHALVFVLVFSAHMFFYWVGGGDFVRGEELRLWVMTGFVLSSFSVGVYTGIKNGV